MYVAGTAGTSLVGGFLFFLIDIPLATYSRLLPHEYFVKTC